MTEFWKAILERSKRKYYVCPSKPIENEVEQYKQNLALLMKVSCRYNVEILVSCNCVRVTDVALKLQDERNEKLMSTSPGVFTTKGRWSSQGEKDITSVKTNQWNGFRKNYWKNFGKNCEKIKKGTRSVIKNKWKETRSAERTEINNPEVAIRTKEENQKTEARGI